MKTRFILILAAILCFFISLNGQNYYPPRPAHISIGTYNLYKKSLDKAYEKGDYYSIGVSLANMGESKERVYKFLNKGIEENPKKCFTIHLFQETYSNQPPLVMETTLTKLSKVEWNKLCKKCETLMDSTSYQQVYNAYVEKNRKKYEAIDSSQFNIELIQTLKEIFEKDQMYRKKIAKSTLSKEEENYLMELQRKPDDENLKKIEQIFDETGYPSVQDVGELYYIPWLVIHHHHDIKVKDKYLPFLEEQAKKGILEKSYIELLKHRIELHQAKSDYQEVKIH